MEIEINAANITTLHGIACALTTAARQGYPDSVTLELQARSVEIGGDKQRLARIKRMSNKIIRGASTADLDGMAATWRKHQMLNGNIL